MSRSISPRGIPDGINFVDSDIVMISEECTAFGPSLRAAIAKYLEVSLFPSVCKSIRLDLSWIAGDLVLKCAYLDVLSQSCLTISREAMMCLVQAAGAGV